VVLVPPVVAGAGTAHSVSSAGPEIPMLGKDGTGHAGAAWGYPAGLRERAVRLVAGSRQHHDAGWAAITSGRLDRSQTSCTTEGIDWVGSDGTRGSAVLVHLVADYGIGDLAFAEVHSAWCSICPVLRSW
jgi:hypothetical protein